MPPPAACLPPRRRASHAAATRLRRSQTQHAQGHAFSAAAAIAAGPAPLPLLLLPLLILLLLPGPAVGVGVPGRQARARRWPFFSLHLATLVPLAPIYSFLDQVPLLQSTSLNLLSIGGVRRALRQAAAPSNYPGDLLRNAPRKNPTNNWAVRFFPTCCGTLDFSCRALRSRDLSCPNTTWSEGEGG